MKQQKMVAVDLSNWWDHNTKFDTILRKPRGSRVNDYVMLQELPLRKYLDSGWTVASYKVAVMEIN